MAQDYNQTLNLPKTEFPMRAGLPKREPDMLKHWYNTELYFKILAENEGKPRFVLHDGPPFSNGDIHMGHALNKILKDFIVRYKNMAGFRAPYVPGWDNHGMPIESAIIKKNKLNRKNMSIPEFRSACRDFAAKYVENQREQFKRLGILGDWEKPYLTMDPAFEALEAKVFGEMFEKGYIYKGLKPVYWCPHDETSLAEAEIEYEDAHSHSIYVKFAVTDDKGRLSGMTDLSNTFFVIWTTTPWTLPGNLAICLNADFQYALIKNTNGETYIVAEKLKDFFLKSCGLEGEVIGTVKGRELEFLTAKHPLYDRSAVVILGDHVTLEAGTGCVHTAPGHGMEDYAVCKSYDDAGKTNIGIIVPVDSRGFMTEEAGQFNGLSYEKANGAIIEALTECGALVAKETMTHQYPHCWRCKKPIIYRATDQWFCSIDAFKETALKACDEVRWMPDWGYERMRSMIRDRADWCISRQRHWGLPIPVFYCMDCGKAVCTPETIDRVSKLFAEKGSNAWYDEDNILPDSFSCPHCGAAKGFERETDTLDCWFDSGSTHIASLERDNKDSWPSDMYLEGPDQYRGWFQSSLLTAVALKGHAPYRSVLTNGWTLDGEGKTMHKSLGNVISPSELVEKYGADIVRLWVSSVDYRSDVRISDQLFKQLSDVYLKIRNTARFILGNLDGFDPDSRVEFDDMPELDKWALTRLDNLTAKVLKAYDNYEFHVIFHSIHNFCVIEMSNFYLDIVKDRLYCEERNSLARRSAQSVIYMILDALVRMLAPILSFTADEIWQSMPHHDGLSKESAMLCGMPSVHGFTLESDSTQKWERLLVLRDDVNKALELARSQKLIGKPLDAELTLYCENTVLLKELESFDLKTLFIVSKVILTGGSAEGLYRGASEGVGISVASSAEPKCTRCWTHDEGVGTVEEHPELCPRCARVILSGC